MNSIRGKRAANNTRLTEDDDDLLVAVPCKRLALGGQAASDNDRNQGAVGDTKVYRYAFTIKLGTSPVPLVITVKDGLLGELIGVFRLFCKKWIVQAKATDGKDFTVLQGRFSLVNKRSYMSALKLLKKHNISHVSLTPSPNISLGFYHLSESIFPVAGPWSDINHDETEKVAVIPPQFNLKPEHYFPWEKTMLEYLDGPPDIRTIDLVYGPDGGEGKSTFSGHLHCTGRATLLPDIDSAETLLKTVASTPIGSKDLRKPWTYILDFARSKAHFTMRRLYAAVETMKTGRFCDPRYSPKDYLRTAPHVWIFANYMPDMTVVGADRWRVWKIELSDPDNKRTGELVRMNFEEARRISFTEKCERLYNANMEKLLDKQMAKLAKQDFTRMEAKNENICSVFRPQHTEELGQNEDDEDDEDDVDDESYEDEEDDDDEGNDNDEEDFSAKVGGTFQFHGENDE